MEETLELIAERIVCESYIPYDFTEELIAIAEWQANRMFALHDEWEKHVCNNFHPEFSSISFKAFVEQHTKK